MSLFTFDMVAYIENLKESTPYLTKYVRNNKQI